MERLRIKSPSECLPLLRRYKNKAQEHFGIIALDYAHNVITTKLLFIGGVTNTIVDNKPISWAIAKSKAVALILWHNHPSGSLLPSEPDYDTTNRVNRLCAIMGVQLLDHIIIGKHTDDYFSFRVHDYDFEKNVKELLMSLDN